MSHPPSDVELLPTDLAGLLPQSCQTLDDNTPDQVINMTLHAKAKLEQATHRPERGYFTSAVAADARTQVFRCHPLVARIPSEILAYVFELYVKGPGASLRGPLYLSQVCARWRAIAESNSRLWTSIHICFPESHASREHDVQRVKSEFDLQLKRSGALPISLTFIDHRGYDPCTKSLVSLLVDRLRTHARRWSRISLQLAGGYFPTLFRFTACDLSSLEYLSINGNSIVYATPIALHLNLESASNLKSFSYNGPGPSIEDKINLHWQRLAEVSFEFAPHYGASFTSYRRFMDLAHCQNIITCSLGIDRPPTFDASQNITLPHLQTLRVRRLSPYAHASGAIHPLILPRLQTLEIDTSNLITRSQRWHDRTFSDLLARSGCTLLHLSIRDVDFPNDELLRCLALSPALVSLAFAPCPRSQDITDVIRRLDVSHQRRGRRRGRVVLPQLRDVTLASSVEAYLPPLLSMCRSRVGARARAAGVAALRCIEVMFFDMWHDTEVDRIHGGDRSERVAGFRAELAKWVSEEGDREQEHGDEGGLEALLVVDSPYLPEYIDLGTCVH